MTLISVAVCVRNGVDWIDGCMESLVQQSHSPLEIILVDDGSTDGSQEKVKQWEGHENVTVINQKPLGLSAGRMAALQAAKSLKPDQKCLCILADGIRNYLSKFVDDSWMKEHDFKIT